MHATDVAINQALGMQLVPPDKAHILEKPETALHLNHVGTVHASVQFALAEASSGEFLLRFLGDAQSEVFAVLRTSEVKFRKPAHGTLRASTRFTDDVANTLSTESAARGRALVW